MYNPLTGMYDNRKEEISKRELNDIQLREVSLVDKAANKKKFLFFKSDGDELDMLLSILDKADFDDDSERAVVLCVDALTSLKADERTAIAKTFMAMLKLADVDIDDGTVLQKIDYDSLRWPSFRSQCQVVAKSEASDKALWPSLVGAIVQCD